MLVGCGVDNLGHVYLSETDSNLTLLNFTEIPLDLQHTPSGITHDHNTKEVYISEWEIGIHKLNLDTMEHELVINTRKYCVNM